MTIHYLPHNAPMTEPGPSRTDLLFWTIGLLFMVAMVLLVPF